MLMYSFLLNHLFYFLLHTQIRNIRCFRYLHYSNIHNKTGVPDAFNSGSIVLMNALETAGQPQPSGEPFGKTSWSGTSSHEWSTICLFKALLLVLSKPCKR